MTKCVWIGVTAALSLTGCAKDGDGGDNSANQSAQVAISNATPQASLPILHNESEGTKNAQAVAPSARPASKPRQPASAGAAQYRALGTEPFWSVTVRGNRATLERPDHPPLTVAVTLTQDPRALRYMGEGVSLLVKPGPCSDGMSDALYADQVQVAFGEGTLKGCGGPRVDETPDDRP